VSHRGRCNGDYVVLLSTPSSPPPHHIQNSLRGQSGECYPRHRQKGVASRHTDHLITSTPSVPGNNASTGGRPIFVHVHMATLFRSLRARSGRVTLPWR
jgi:hypothetical protein